MYVFLSKDIPLPSFCAKHPIAPAMGPDLKAGLRKTDLGKETNQEI